MSRVVAADVTCSICGERGSGVVMATVPGESATHAQLFQGCLLCLGEMFDVARLLEMRFRQYERRNFPRRADYGPEWNRIHGWVLERDGNECQDEDHEASGGGRLGESLVVHHIKPLREFNGDYLAANQPENLVTLCLSCHGRWHGELTRAKNRSAQ